MLRKSKRSLPEPVPQDQSALAAESNAEHSVLVFGSQPHQAPGVTCLEWGEQPPYLPHYDTVILNLTPFQDPDAAGNINWALLPSSAWFARLLINGTDIIAIIGGRPTGDEFWMPPKESSQISFVVPGDEKEKSDFSYGPPDLRAIYATPSLMWWFPGTIRLSLQEGRPIKTFMQNFQPYFETVQRTEFVIDPHSLATGRYAVYNRRLAPQDRDSVGHDWHKLLTESPALKAGPLKPPLHETQVYLAMPSSDFEIGWTVRPVAANEHGQPVGIGAILSATEVALDARHCMTPGDSANPYSGRYHLEESGIAYVVPASTDVSVHDGIDVLLASVLRLPVRTPKPAWVSLHTLPGQAQIERDLAECQKAAEHAERQLETAEATIDTFTQPLGLLYETEAGLEHLVRDTFREMGAMVDDPVSANAGKEDGILTFGPHCGVLEIKSHKRTGFNLKEMRQLNQWVDDYYERTGERVKGVFVGNHETTIEPAQRSQPFPDNALNFAISRQFCVLTSVDLFAALCAVRSNQVQAEAVLESIFRTIGRWNPKDPIRASK